MRDFITDMWSEEWLVLLGLLGLIILMILLIPMSIYSGIKEAEQWEIFKAEYNCKIVGHERGHTSTGIAPIISGSGNGGVGIVITSTPDKTGWQCDDGVTYWR